MTSNARPVKVFSGNTSRPLAEAICRELGVELSNNTLSTLIISIRYLVRRCWLHSRISMSRQL